MCVCVRERGRERGVVQRIATHKEKWSSRLLHSISHKCPGEKVWIHLCSSKLWVKEQDKLGSLSLVGNQSMRRKTLDSNLRRAVWRLRVTLAIISLLPAFWLVLHKPSPLQSNNLYGLSRILFSDL